MLRIIQSDYTPLGTMRVSEVIKLCKETGDTPVLADAMSFQGLAEFSVECSKHGVKGLAGLRVPILVNDIVANVTMVANNHIGLSSLSALLTSNPSNAPLPVSELAGTLNGVSCIIDHTVAGVSPSATHSYRDIFSKVSSVIGAKNCHFGYYSLSDSASFELVKHNEDLDGWYSKSGSAALKNFCIPISIESFTGVKGYSLASGRYLALNSADKPSVSDVKSSIPKWMDSESFKSNVHPEFMTDNESRFMSLSEDYIASVLREEEVVDLGIDWSLRARLESDLSEYLKVRPELDVDVYISRLDEELKVSEREGFDNYFKAMIAFADYCQSNGIPIKIRGSGASSLMCFLGGLSSEQCDPVELRLDFRRFMGARIETPDIDIDISASLRTIFNQFLHQYTGAENVAALTTQGKQETYDTLLRQAHEVMLFRYGEGELFDFDFPKVPLDEYPPFQFLKDSVDKYGTKKLSRLAKDESFKIAVKRNDYIKALVDVGLDLSGLRGKPIKHPSAIVVNPDPSKFIPFISNGIGENIASVPYEFAKKVGLLKYDILSSPVLETLNSAKKRIGADISNFVEDSLRGDGGGIFRFIGQNPTGLMQLTGSESSLRCLKGINPNKFEELVAFSALIRPGVSDKNSYLKNSNVPAFNDEVITELLSDTRGFLIFEDQILQIAIDVAGMTPSEADILRTGIKKGDEKLILSQRDNFVSGMLNGGRTEEQSVKLWDKLESYKGQYLFNKAHATEYGITTVEQAIVKRDYPNIFLDEIILPSDKGRSATKKLLPDFIAELKSAGVDIAPPCINKISHKVSVYKSNERTLYPSLKVYGISEKMREAIGSVPAEQLGKKFNDLTDFIRSVMTEYLGSKPDSLMGTPVSSMRMFNSEMNTLIKFGFFDNIGLGEDVDLSQLTQMQLRNVLIEASDQVQEILSNPFIPQDEQNLTFTGEVKYTEYERDEILSNAFGTHDVYSKAVTQDYASTNRKTPQREGLTNKMN
ncbi:DNA polymerase III alpha subunit [Vibrio chagasii]|nr:DNA polymerase III alpha subunit [Vibrio chagasii]